MLDVRAPSLLLKANLDGLRWYLDNLINYDPASSAKFKERLLRTNGHHSFYYHDANLAFDCHLGSNTIVLDGVSVGQKSALRDCVVSSQGVVGDQCVLEKCLVGKSAKIGNGSVVKDSIVGRNCVIGANAKIISSIIEEGSQVGEGEKIENEILRADGSRKTHKSKASFNKFILEDDLEFNSEDEEQDEAEEVEQIGKKTLTRLQCRGREDPVQRGGPKVHRQRSGERGDDLQAVQQ